MGIVLFALAALITLGATFVFFRLFGAQSDNLFFDLEEKRQWDERIEGSLGRYVTQSNVFGALTSLATLLFLAGSAKLFGVFAFATGLTIALSGSVTNFITNRLLAADQRMRLRYSDSEQVGGVIASLFWDRDLKSRRLSGTVKWISIVAILSVIWLEISLFAVFATSTLRLEGPGSQAVFAFGAFFVILYFVLRYGIRGFVFADLLHAPLIAVAGLALVCLLAYRLASGEYSLTPSTLIEPSLPWGMALLFGLHVLALNLFQVACTEAHWFRLWLLRDAEISAQRSSVWITGFIWLLLLFIGFSTFAITGKVGEEAIVQMLHGFEATLPIFLFLFWVASIGALFSTVDTQMYSMFLVYAFNADTGKLPINTKKINAPLTISIAISAIFAFTYFGVRFFEIPFEKILLVVVPFPLVVLPSLVAKLLGREPQIWQIVVSVLGYSLVALVGFVLPGWNFYATLSAVFVPVVIAVLILSHHSLSRGRSRGR